MGRIEERVYGGIGGKEIIYRDNCIIRHSCILEFMCSMGYGVADGEGGWGGVIVRRICVGDVVCEFSC